jgi:hypothetical protein
MDQRLSRQPVTGRLVFTGVGVGAVAVGVGLASGLSVLVEVPLDVGAPDRVPLADGVGTSVGR